jgi:restriction system protein
VTRSRIYRTADIENIVLIDGVQLADLMLEHGVGVTAVRSYDLKRLDAEYFVEE